MQKNKTVIMECDFILRGEIAVNVPENFKSKNLDKIRKQLVKQDPDNYLNELMVLDKVVAWEMVYEESMFRPDVIKLFRVRDIQIVNEDLDGINELLSH